MILYIEFHIYGVVDMGVEDNNCAYQRRQQKEACEVRNKQKRGYGWNRRVRLEWPTSCQTSPTMLKDKNSFDQI